MALNFPHPLKHYMCRSTATIACMVYDASSLADGMNASYVIGQPTFTSNTAATTQSWS
jgi:hypothetical protein